ncbi:MAG TPA: ABC transporter ATP-binding protein [Longilinea sp.]|nr:ABC transporter ATP-binding protein [Longilinea sp.]
MLKLENVSKTYRVGTFGGKELHAVNNVTFDIKENEVVSLIGESGSGKSTIGKMILKLITPTAGKIMVADIDISTIKETNIKEYYRTVQGVFQDPFSCYNPIFKADRLFKNIHEEFYPDVQGQAWEEKVDEVMKCVGLNPEHVLNKFPHQLSGGQLQRFLIARALLLDIKLLVADEIISMLDASTRIDILNLLGELKKKGLSILFITHDLSLAYYISERAVILYRGCVAEFGSSGKIFGTPVHPYTKMLMASVPRLDKKWESVDIHLEEEGRNHYTGCAYYSRCLHPRKDAQCTTKQPPLVEVEPDHFAACYKL